MPDLNRIPGPVRRAAGGWRVGVLKFGGSTFPDPAAYARTAAHLARRITTGQRLVVTVSAGPGQTEQLRARLLGVNPRPQDQTVAGLLTLADTTSAHQLAAALHATGHSAVVLAGHQVGFVTVDSLVWARLDRLDRAPLDTALAEHEVVIIPGGQAVDATGRPSWMGKNSSDLSAIASAAAIGADRCEIYSDVDGVYTADPRLVPAARLIPQTSYDAVALLSACGAKVLHSRAVGLARRHGVTIVCRINRPPHRAGTVISDRGAPLRAVVCNRMSSVIRFGTTAEADYAHSVFTRAGIETLRDDDAPVVILVNGYVDVPRFLADRAMTGAVTGQTPVIGIQDATTRIHYAPDADRAVELAGQLHDAVVRTDDDRLLARGESR